VRYNVAILFVVCVGYGFSTGCVDFVVPYYLRSLGMSFKTIGTIFTVSAIAMFFLRLYLARLSDLVGRKALYVGSLVLSSVSFLAFPFVRSLLGLAGLRTGADLSFSVRETMHATALYETRAHGYLNLQGKTRGVEMLFTALGTLAGGYLLFSYAAAFAVPFVVLMATTAAFSVWFAEPAELAVSRSRTGLLELVTTAFPREIKVLGLSGFIFGIAISMSHRYMPPLFFSAKFQLAEGTVAQIQLVHILSHVLPLFLVGWLVTRRLKTVFFWTLLVEGVFLGLAGCFGRLGPTLFFWWTHDIIGAGLWAPIQWALIQRYARKESRGLGASFVPAAMALGSIPGPFLAGQLAELTRVPFTAIPISEAVAVSLPLVVSGAIMVASAIPLLWLPADAATGTQA